MWWIIGGSVSLVVIIAWLMRDKRGGGAGEIIGDIFEGIIEAGFDDD